MLNLFLSLMNSKLDGEGVLSGMMGDSSAMGRGFQVGCGERDSKWDWGVTSGMEG
jgi:hypothetical protein